MQSLPIEVPPEFDPQLQRPKVGERCYVIGGYDECTPIEKQIEAFGKPPAELYLHHLQGSWKHGVATLRWREPGRTWATAHAPADTLGDPEIRMQCFNPDVITSSPEVAQAPRHLLKRYGWNLR